MLTRLWYTGDSGCLRDLCLLHIIVRNGNFIVQLLRGLPVGVEVGTARPSIMSNLALYAVSLFSVRFAIMSGIPRAYPAYRQPHPILTLRHA